MKNLSSIQAITLFTSFCVLFLLALFSLSLGSIDISLPEVLRLLQAPEDSAASRILYELRLPRVLLSAVVGGSLAVSGAVMQGVFRNPLADPGLIGVSAGAALGISVAIVCGQYLQIDPAYSFIAVSAFVFGMSAMVLVYLIALKEGQSQIATLLLAGVALSAFCTALSALFMYLSNDQQLRQIGMMNLGSLSGSSWLDVKIGLYVLLPVVLCLLMLARPLNVLLLGESQARHLGISVENLKLLSFVLVSLLVSVSVSMVGIIGFVGLVVPHVVRILFGASHGFLLSMSFILGAALLLIADTISRTLISPAELPIGILTALIGCPFFIFLLFRFRQQVLFHS